MKPQPNTPQKVSHLLVRTYQELLRWRYVLANHKHRHDRLNRCVDVESVLWAVASKKRGPLTPDECRELALKLGVPDEFRAANERKQP